MKINDRIYGMQEINQKILVELINSKSVQRLKDISQLGMPDEYYHLPGFSRYEHSLGVLILLKNLGARLEEQIAGLLHDVSHPPFSHVIDWAIGDPTKEDYQDKIHEDFLKSSEIPLVLEKHGFDIKFISNYKNFKLLEKQPPSLCADRLDYSLREIGMQKGKNLVRKILGDLSVKESQIVFRTESIAKIFGEGYMQLQTEHWGGDEARSRYYILSNVLNKAFKNNLIGLEDLKKNEEYILRILNNSGDESILNGLNLLKRGFNIIRDSNGIELKKKFRYVDPEVMVDGAYFPLSKISEEYSSLIDLEKKKNTEINKVRIVPN
jgi:HD superfamily phosphohydrolase